MRCYHRIIYIIPTSSGVLITDGFVGFWGRVVSATAVAGAAGGREVLV